MKKTPGSQGTSHLLIVVVLLVIFSLIQLFVNFRGLGTQDAIDQAQVARQVARGEGMTTKYIRPIALATYESQANSKAAKEEGELKKAALEQDQDASNIHVDSELNVLALPDTSHAPLNILADALALKIAGADNYDSWKIEPGYNLYGPDRIIAGVSVLFFVLSVLFVYMLVKRIFDESIASITAILLIFSDLFLDFSISGLPQMMMLCFFTVGMNFLYTAIIRQQDKKQPLVPLLLASLFFCLVCLSGWIGIWAFLGFAIFIGIYFRPYGLYSLPALIILVLLVTANVYYNRDHSGNPFGIAIYSLFQGITGSDNMIMRAVAQGDVPINTRAMFTTILGNTLRQITQLFSNMGGIIVVPFFFLALFHPFKNKATNILKWAVFSIWIASTFGMSLYWDQTELSSGQLQILSAPLFTAFGLALLFVMIGRVLSVHDIKGLKGFVVAMVILISSGPLIMSIPDTLKMGLASESSGYPQWPPYFPPSLNGALHDATKPDKVIASDQPWAVAWYADRPSMWLPRKKDAFIYLEDILKKHGSSIGGILITPSSHSLPGGVRAATETYGDFANFVMEGTLIDKFPSYTSFLNSNSGRMGEEDPISARFSHSRSRLPLMFGYQIMYYSEEPINTNQ